MAMLVGTIKTFIADERGATAIEYGMLAAMIAVALVATLTVFGNSLQGLFNNGAAEVLTSQAAKIN